MKRHLSGDAHFEGAAGLCTVAEDAHHGGEQIDDGRLDLSVGGTPQIAMAAATPEAEPMPHMQNGVVLPMLT